MLPDSVMDFKAEISVESIIAELTEEQEQVKTQADLLGTTMTPMTTQEIQTKAELLFKVRTEEKKKQEKQAIFVRF
jgi:vacuolar-type H+-ATPase subunit H